MKRIILAVIALLMIGSIFAAGTEKLVIIGFDAMDRESRYIKTMLDKRDINNIFGEDDHFELIFGKPVNNALKQLNIESNMDELSSENANLIGESLDASIVVWGTVIKVSDTMFRISGSMRSQRSGNLSRFSFEVSRDKNQREEAINQNLLNTLKEFSIGESSKLFNIALQQFNNKQYETAEEQFLRIIEIDSNNIDAYYYLGYIKFEQGSFAEASDYYNNGLQIDPNSEKLLLYLSESYKRQGKLDDAIEALEKVAQNNNDPRIFLNIARLYKDRGLPTEAMNALDQALENDAEYDQAHELYAEIAYDNNFYEKAITHLIFMTDLKPDDEEFARKLALSYQKTNQLDKAIQRYQEIIAQDNNNLKAYMNLASAYRAIAQESSNEAKKYNQLALNAFLEAKRIDQENPRIEISISDVYLALNDYVNAEKYAKAADKKQDNLYEASQILGTIAQRKGIEKYNQYVELQTQTDSGKLYGDELDSTISKRDKTKIDAHTFFTQADELFKQSLQKTDSDKIKNEIQKRIQTNQQYIDQTKPDFFN